MPTPIDLIVADDHSLFIEGLQLLLKSEPDIAISAVAYSGKELLALLQKRRPQMVLLDINMPGINGLETARYIKQSYNDVKIIMLSTYQEEHLIEKAKQYGANGYLLKNTNRDELLQTIRLVATGHACFPYSSPVTVNGFSEGDPFLRQFDLTKREMEILGYIKNGLTNQQIADALFLSIYTVETHRKHIMRKLQLNSPAALMKFIVEHKL